MKMIGQKDIGVKFNFVAAKRFTQEGKKPRAILLISEDAFAAIATSAKMIKRSFKLQPQRTRH
jgi:hypothetical protein